MVGPDPDVGQWQLLSTFISSIRILLLSVTDNEIDVLLPGLRGRVSSIRWLSELLLQLLLCSIALVFGS